MKHSQWSKRWWSTVSRSMGMYVVKKVKPEVGVAKWRHHQVGVPEDCRVCKFGRPEVRNGVTISRVIPVHLLIQTQFTVMHQVVLLYCIFTSLMVNALDNTSPVQPEVVTNEVLCFKEQSSSVSNVLTIYLPCIPGSAVFSELHDWLFVPLHFSSRERKFQEVKADVENFRSLELSFPRTKVPRNFCSLELLFCGTFAPTAANWAICLTTAAATTWPPWRTDHPVAWLLAPGRSSRL